MWDFYDTALEAIDRPDTWILKNAFYDRICTSLAKPANQRMLFQHIAKYRDKNIDVLSSPYILKIMLFNLNGEDGNIIFKACGVDKSEVEPVLKETLKAIKLDRVNNTGDAAANVIPFRVMMIMAMAYFWDEKPKLRTLWLYYTYSFYFSVFNNYFQRKDAINEECMIYTINSMSNKFDIKKQASLENMLDSTMAVAIDSYSNLFKSLSDMDIVNLINAFKTRVSHKIASIRKEYDKNYKSGDRIFTTVERNQEGEFIDRENNLSSIDILSSQYTSAFFHTQLNERNINISANLNQVSASELKTALSLLQQGKNNKEVRLFYNCIFQLFFEEYPNAKTSDVNSNKFLVAADAIYKKGNSNNPNVLKIKDLTHIWLKKGSNTYRSSTRPDTLNRYRKAIYIYFALCVSTKQ